MATDRGKRVLDIMARGKRIDFPTADAGKVRLSPNPNPNSDPNPNPYALTPTPTLTSRPPGTRADARSSRTARGTLGGNFGRR